MGAPWKRGNGKTERGLLQSLGLFSVLLLFAGAAALFLLQGSGRAEALPAVSVLEDAAGLRPLFLEPRGDEVLAGLCGEDRTLLLRLDAGGSLLALREIDGPSGWAGLRGGAVFVREDSDGEAVLSAWDPETLGELGRRPLYTDPADFLLFDCDFQGDVFYVLSASRDVLRLDPAEGVGEDLRYPEELSFLQAGEEGGRLAASARTLWTESREYSCPAGVLAAFAGGLLMDGDGVLCRLTEEGAESLFRCASPLYDRLSYCLDQEDCLILSTGGGVVTRTALNGESAGVCRVESTPLALCRAGALTRKDGVLRWTAFAFEDEAPAEESPSPHPSPTMSPPAWLEGDYLIVEAGTTADALRELMKPGTADIRDRRGNSMLRGRLASGMTVNGQWLIVVEGDCDGTGTLTRADLQAALAMAEEGGEITGAESRAADLDHNGVVNTADLLLLRKLIDG